MKKISIILLTILLIVPPLQAHTDAIVFANEVETHVDEIDDMHHNEHHQNDTEEEKNKEHHHHCNVITVTADFIPTDYSYNIPVFLEVRNPINFYQNTYYNSYLSAIFQPPKV
ncbi:MAG: hypothetical protein HWD85_03980 [Flavobacteriaceae bacterium]|nr:hypothetical protein [Flavobacteriaceae bacterium]